MENEPEPQQQQPYPQQPYPVYNPPQKDKRTMMIVVVVAVTIAIAVPSVLLWLTWPWVFAEAPSCCAVPYGSWKAYMLGPTEIDLEFGKITGSPRPMDLEILLIRNQSVEGKYSFANNYGGQLVLATGSDVGTLTYVDLMENQKVNLGDYLRVTDLMPGSHYTAIMIWAPTGDEIASTTFATPA